MTNERWGVGASLLRREDERHLHGRGEFVSDIKLPATMEVAFLRSPHAHARIKSIAIPPEAAGRVFTAADLPALTPVRVATQAAGAKSPAWPPLAVDKARYVGEAIVACLAPTRGEAEDLAASITVITRCSTRWSTPSAICTAALPSSTSSGATISISNGRPKVATSRALRARPRSR